MKNLAEDEKVELLQKIKDSEEAKEKAKLKQ